MVTGLSINSKAFPDPICKPCLAGKLNALPFASSPSYAAAPLDLIHTDLKGPLKMHTHSRCHFWVTFIDDHTQFCVMFLHSKDKAFEVFRWFQAYAENH